jgi:hypothetical protein
VVTEGLANQSYGQENEETVNPAYSNANARVDGLKGEDDDTRDL